MTDFAALASDLVKSMISSGSLKDASQLAPLLTQIGSALKEIEGSEPVTQSTVAGASTVGASSSVIEPKQELAPQKLLSATQSGKQPAVPIRESVQPDFIICLEDGRKMKMLKRHLRTAFNMTPEEYRARWSLPHNYPMIAPNFAKQKSKYAKYLGLGTHRKREDAEEKEIVSA